MLLEVRIETYPLDWIRPGQTFIYKEGQLVMKGPIFNEGEAILEDNAHVILEDI